MSAWLLVTVAVAFSPRNCPAETTPYQFDDCVRQHFGWELFFELVQRMRVDWQWQELRTLEPAVHDRLAAFAKRVLEIQEGDHQPRADTRSARVGGITSLEFVLETGSVASLSHNVKGMPRRQQFTQLRPKQFPLLTC